MCKLDSGQELIFSVKRKLKIVPNVVTTAL